jgi:hypothetical protein
MGICGISPIYFIFTFLCCGIIFIYFNMRLAEVKQMIDKQNRVLTAFITNVQQDLAGGGKMFDNDSNMNGLASNSAINTVREMMSDKIIVSDSEDSDSEDSDSEDSNSEDSDSEDSESEDNGNTIEHFDESNGIINIMPIGDINNDDIIDNSTIEDLTNVIHDLGDSSETIKNFEQMKVDELRKYIIDNKNVLSEEAKKLKKNEILALLKK